MTNQKTLGAYFTGFSLCLLFTIIAFTLTGMKTLNEMSLYLLLSGLAILQFIVQSICFLGLNKSQEGRIQLLPYLFMIVIVFILVGGTIWIMNNLNYNMAH